MKNGTVTAVAGVRKEEGRGTAMRWPRRIAGALLLACCLAAPALAGEGSVDATNGNIDFNVHFRFPPTPQQLTDLKATINLMAQGVCDATDGQMRVRQVTLSQGQATEDQGDFWLHALPGRSGVSFFGDGSGLGNLGTHVTMLSGALFVPDVYLHEFGHLAFGLGDEYDEQNRWGGPCGIGPSFDTGINEQNHTIMQQSGSAQCVGGPTPGMGCFSNAGCGAGGACRLVLMSELSVNGNHDPLRGTNNTCPVVANMCTDNAYCMRVWNATTNRYETTQQTEMHGGLSDWATLDQNYPFVTPPAGLPTAAAPAACATAVTFVDNVVGSDQVLLILDKSGSMSWSSQPGQNEICGNGADDDNDGATDETECADPRIKFVKEAANAYLDLQQNNSVDVGIMTFNDTATLDRMIGTLNAGNLAAYKGVVNGIMPGGNTGIGDALAAAKPEFNRVMAAGRSRTAYLMTDGFNTSGILPETGAQALRDIGVRIHVIPAGSDVNAVELGSVASSTGGQVFPAPAANELIGVYAELAALHRGAALAFPRTNFTLSRRGSELSHASNSPPERAFPIHVERNAKALVGFIAGRNARMADWAVQIELRGPNGEHFGPGSPELTVATSYLFLNVISPAEGDWNLVVRATGPALQEATAVAFIDNPEPDFFVDVRPRIMKPGVNAKLSATPSFVTALDKDGVAIAATLVMPDGTRTPLSVEQGPGRAWGADIGPQTMDGAYRIEATLQVDASAKPAQGEAIFQGPERPAIDVVPFNRSAETGFFVVDSGGFACLDPRKLDCDRDGVPDSRECREFPPDIDRDGRPNDRDTDADGDEIPDSVEGMRDNDGNGRPDMCEKSPPKVAPPQRDGGRPQPGRDCIRIHPRALALRSIDGDWRIVDGNVSVYGFGADKASAQKALRILQVYDISHVCRIGRPKPRLMYLLSEGQLPSGRVEGEQCVQLARGDITVKREREWSVFAGRRPLFAFAGDQGQANEAAQLIREHQPAYACTIGRANPPFQYLRK